MLAGWLREFSCGWRGCCPLPLPCSQCLLCEWAGVVEGTWLEPSVPSAGGGGRLSIGAPGSAPPGALDARSNTVASCGCINRFTSDYVIGSHSSVALSHSKCSVTIHRALRVKLVLAGHCSALLVSLGKGRGPGGRWWDPRDSVIWDLSLL